jgi:hypothetical protein
MADRVLALVRKAFNWWATRDDHFEMSDKAVFFSADTGKRACIRGLENRRIFIHNDGVTGSSPVCGTSHQGFFDVPQRGSARFKTGSASFVSSSHSCGYGPVTG